jgi:hypothetical protein
MDVTTPVIIGGFEFQNVASSGYEFVGNIPDDEMNRDIAARNSLVLGDPQPTCMAIWSTKRACELGFVGTYRKIER